MATRIVVFLTEDDRAGRRSAYAELVQRAQAAGMAGVTVWRGIEGFGASGRVRTSRFPDAAGGLPVAVELIDIAERVEAFIGVVHEVAPGALVTRQQVEVAGDGQFERTDGAPGAAGGRRAAPGDAPES